MEHLRKTKSVKLVLRKFEQTDDAQSVVGLVEGLKQEMNKTTVYRILQRLEDNDVLHSFKGKDGRKWYAKCSQIPSTSHRSTHPHFQCKVCGRIECLSFEVDIPHLPNHLVESAELLLVGRCSSCGPNQ